VQGGKPCIMQNHERSSDADFRRIMTAVTPCKSPFHQLPGGGTITRRRKFLRSRVQGWRFFRVRRQKGKYYPPLDGRKGSAAIDIYATDSSSRHSGFNCPQSGHISSLSAAARFGHRAWRGWHSQPGRTGRRRELSYD